MTRMVVPRAGFSQGVGRGERLTKEMQRMALQFSVCIDALYHGKNFWEVSGRQ